VVFPVCGNFGFTQGQPPEVICCVVCTWFMCLLGRHSPSLGAAGMLLLASVCPLGTLAGLWQRSQSQSPDISFALSGTLQPQFVCLSVDAAGQAISSYMPRRGHGHCKAVHLKRRDSRIGKMFEAASCKCILLCCALYFALNSE
jgi:hypothetical protein